MTGRGAGQSLHKSGEGQPVDPYSFSRGSLRRRIVQHLVQKIICFENGVIEAGLFQFLPQDRLQVFLEQFAYRLRKRPRPQSEQSNNCLNNAGHDRRKQDHQHREGHRAFQEFHSPSPR